MAVHNIQVKPVSSALFDIANFLLQTAEVGG
jgi:hypothetical protein